MDELALRVLWAEVQADLRVIAEAARLAQERFARRSDAGARPPTTTWPGCTTPSSRWPRASRAFENRVEPDPGWHIALLRRLRIAVPGVRPALLDAELAADLQELRAFRHRFRHAYDLALDAARLQELVTRAARVAQRLPAAVDVFVRAVAGQEGWSLE